MKTDQITVKKSKIEGQGVFAKRDFKKGEAVLHWDISNTLSEGDVEKMNEKEKEYISFLNEKYVIMQEPEKYVNHSCEANTTAKNFCDVAIRDIKKGEEITANYTEELPPGVCLKCLCGSKKCKKIINLYEKTMRKNFLFLTLIFCFLPFYPALANPVNPKNSALSGLFSFVYIYLSAFILETLVLLFFFKKILSMKRIISNAFLAHLLSVPSMYLIIFLWFTIDNNLNLPYDFSIIFLIIIEASVIFIESFFYNWRINNLFRKKLINEKFKFSKIFLITLLANIVSFIIGTSMLILFFNIN